MAWYVAAPGTTTDWPVGLAAFEGSTSASSSSTATTAPKFGEAIWLGAADVLGFAPVIGGIFRAAGWPGMVDTLDLTTVIGRMQIEAAQRAASARLAATAAPVQAGRSVFGDALEVVPTIGGIFGERVGVTSSDVAPSAPTPVTAPSVVPLHRNRDRVKARFRLLRRLSANHDNEGASAPCHESIDAAIAFIDHMATFPPFSATLDDDGSAVIEFEDRSIGFFADLTFHSDGRVECYKREPGKPSEYFEGELESADARDFLENHMHVVLS